MKEHALWYVCNIYLHRRAAEERLVGVKLVRYLGAILPCSMSISVMDGHMSRVFALAYHPSDSRILVSAGWDDTVQVLSAWGILAGVSN